MLFHALLSSPFGDILLSADAHSLTGLYFTDQRHCPPPPGPAAASEVVSRPTAGTLRGRAARTLKAVRAGDAGELFGTDAQTTASGPATLRLLQMDTPAG